MAAINEVKLEMHPLDETECAAELLGGPNNLRRTIGDASAEVAVQLIGRL